jgi:tetratricopeptide (TPR) repeat protein
LLLAVGLTFAQTAGFGFVNFDDRDYVYDNRNVSDGVSGEGIRWAFTQSHVANWHPLTWISLMLDCSLYGLNPARLHLTNVLLHAATVVLLFLVLRAMTGGTGSASGTLWPSALVAALFAVHPLRAESVAWVTERKDVLSGLFFVLTLGAYASYARRPFSFARYAAVMALFALGLLSKATLVTVPCLLLLLDYWPLGRMTAKKPRSSIAPSPLGSSIAPSPARSSLSPPGTTGGLDFAEAAPGRFSVLARLLAEKIPLLLLAALASGMTIWAQSEAIVSQQHYNLWWRLRYIPIAYLSYLVRFFWPADLAALYPRPNLDLPPWQTCGALAILLGITAASIVWAPRRPYLLVGWLWYLGMLVPVVGFLQVGVAATADRNTYLAQIGLTIALVWIAADARWTRPYLRPRWGVAAASVIVVLLACAWRQTTVWRNSEALWTRTLACTSRNAVAHNDLGVALTAQGRIGEAIAHFQKALEIKTDYAEAHYNLGNAAMNSGRIDEALAQFREALNIKPDYAEAHYNLGLALASRGRIDEAIAHYQRALEIKPNSPLVHNNLGTALAGRARIDDAMLQFREALKIDPDYAEAHYNLGIALTAHGRNDEAMTHYQKALEIKADYAEAHYGLGLALARRARIDEAIDRYRKALDIKPGYAEARYNLGAALAGRGRIDEAMAQFREALKTKPDYAEAHYNLGTALAGRGRIDEAMAQFREALKIKPDYAEAHYNLGTALANRRQVDEAIDHYRKGLLFARQQNNLALAEALKARLRPYEAGTPRP